MQDEHIFSESTFEAQIVGHLIPLLLSVTAGVCQVPAHLKWGGVLRLPIV